MKKSNTAALAAVCAILPAISGLGGIQMPRPVKRDFDEATSEDTKKKLLQNRLAADEEAKRKSAERRARRKLRGGAAPS